MSLETLEIIHDATHILTIPLSIIIGMWYAPKYGYEKHKAAMYSLTMMIIIVLFTYACEWIPGWFGFTVFINAARTFIFVPFFTLVLSRYSNISMLHGADFMTPIIFFVRTVVLIGCTIIGCGQAIPSDWGIYSPNYGYTVFPMDLIDLVGTFLIGVISLIYAKRLQYQGDGRIFALSMICLGVIRSLIQFGSTDRYFGIRGFNDETIISIISIIMGAMIFQIYENKVKLNGGLDNENK